MINQSLHFIGTSHVRALERGSLHHDLSNLSLTFTALGAPLLRLFLNQCELQVHGRSIRFLVPDPQYLLNIFDHLDDHFQPMRRNLVRFLEAPILVQDLPFGASVILVDPLFRVTPRLTQRVQSPHSTDRTYYFDGCPMTLSSLAKFNDLAGDFCRYVEPFYTHLPFNQQGAASVTTLIKSLISMGSDVSVWIWRSPDFFGNQIDLEAHDDLHQWRLQKDLVDAHLIPFPRHLLNPLTGSALPQFRGNPGHGNEVFGIQALQHILDCV